VVEDVEAKRGQAEVDRIGLGNRHTEAERGAERLRRVLRDRQR
jgi:hypothetical protein